MSAAYLVAGAVSIALLIYLVLAMLKPEWFG
jgi:K+-transporting ATPase KdpF subunit